ncbi:hypothetical protein RKD55_001038 [Rossellomorea marisflavi]
MMYRFHPFHANRPAPQSSIGQQRVLPAAAPDTLMASAGKTLSLMDDAKLVLGRINSSREFASKLMTAAQQSNLPEVHKLLQTIPTRVQPVVSFNPDGVRFVFDEKLGQVDCCHLIVSVKWSEF